MATPDNFHSQLVGWSKIILPLCALGLLSTLFLFARSNRNAADIPFAEIAALAQDQRINAPRFSGVADDGSIIAISAQSAKIDPDATDRFNIAMLKLVVNAPDGSELRVTAVEGEVDGGAKIAQLKGLARLETSNGYSMETNGLAANLETGVVGSDGALEVHAPFGEITAGRVTFQSADDNSGHQMLFTEGVRLVYTPSNTNAEDAKE
ncbi:MAG: hypothetical protein P8P56_05585 [Yoonia sp.]|nr:hypothetical protein [Yoonia sp.]MDG1862650.1 hypothetical protein [Yoonia sp.]